MRLNEIAYENTVPIDGYGPGFFRIGGQVHHGSMAIFPSGIQQWGGYDDTGTLIDHVAEIDVVFVGTGGEIAHVPADFRTTLEEAGLGVEVMASPTACRTYNVLLSEGRRIALALIPV